MVAPGAAAARRWAATTTAAAGDVAVATAAASPPLRAIHVHPIRPSTHRPYPTIHPRRSAAHGLLFGSARRATYPVRICGTSWPPSCWPCWDWRPPRRPPLSRARRSRGHQAGGERPADGRCAGRHRRTAARGPYRPDGSYRSTTSRPATITSPCGPRDTARAAPRWPWAPQGHARPGGRARSALCRGAVGEPQPAAAVRVVSAHVGAGRTGPRRSSSKPRSRATLAIRAGHRHASVWSPRPARPVIRGLDGDRVAVLQDGQRVGRLVEPIRRSRCPRQSVRGNARSKSCAAQPRCCTAPMRSAGWSTSSPIRFPASGCSASASSRSIWVPTAARPAAPATSTSATAGGPSTSAAAAQSQWRLLDARGRS